MQFPINTLEQVEGLISQMYAANDPALQKQAEEYLKLLQKEVYAWDLAPQLLGSQSVNSRFFGAHTLQIKIARDWDTLPEEKIPWLREQILSWLLQLSDGPAVVTTKLCVAIVAYALHAVPRHWSNFIHDTCQCLEQSVVTRGQATRERVVCVLLEFLTVVPEEVGRADLVGDQKVKINQELSDAIPFILSMLPTLLSEHHGASDELIKNKALRCLQSWIQYGIPISSLHPILKLVLSFLPMEPTRDSATDVLLEFMSHPASATLQDTVCLELISCMMGEWMKGEILKRIQEQDEQEIRNFCRLLSTFGENYTEWIARHFVQPDILAYLEIMIMLTGFPGFYGAEQEISEMPLNFWYLLQESICEFCPDQTGGVREASRMVYRKLVEVLREKIVFPPDEVWNAWTRDIRDRFKVYRRDVGDTLINSYYILREEMLAVLVEYAGRQLASPSPDALQLEGTIFSIKCISEAVPNTENVYIPRIFGDEVFGQLLTINCFRMRYTTLSMIGSYADWLKEHPQYLLPALNYLIPALGVPDLAFVSALAFKSVCDTCRHSLVAGLESLINMYLVVGKHIQPREKQRVIESVASVVQALPQDKWVEPLEALLGDVLQTLRESCQVPKEASTRTLVIDNLHCLTACCRGLQSPDDEYQSSVERMACYSKFADTDPTEMNPKIAGMQRALEEMAHSISIEWSEDMEVIQGLCQFIDASSRTMSHLLALRFETLVTLLPSGFQRHQHACWLDSASQLVVVYGEGKRADRLARLSECVGALTRVVLDLLKSKADMEQNPDVISAFFSLYSRIITRFPGIFYQLPADLVGSVVLAAVAGIGIQERMALRSALGFMTEFIGQDYEDHMLGKAVHGMMMEVGHQIMHEVLSGIGGRLPRGMIAQLVDILYKMIGRYPEACRQWLNTLLSQENYPSAHVDQNAKQAFIKGVMSTRSPKRFKAAVNEFSLKCRRLENTAFGQAF
ncbi:uncharacterized protein VTP21DRAFT_6582 [Calcarisporiella thermophila]|uniref:uncharacterized protein n=1 Tax=Calcarisporiella thermophila TaxID=911321 RepID=UPI0037431FB6